MSSSNSLTNCLLIKQNDIKININNAIREQIEDLLLDDDVFELLECNNGDVNVLVNKYVKKIKPTLKCDIKNNDEDKDNEDKEVLDIITIYYDGHYVYNAYCRIIHNMNIDMYEKIGYNGLGIQLCNNKVIFGNMIVTKINQSTEMIEKINENDIIKLLESCYIHDCVIVKNDGYILQRKYTHTPLEYFMNARADCEKLKICEVEFNSVILIFMYVDDCIHGENKNIDVFNITTYGDTLVTMVTNNRAYGECFSYLNINESQFLKIKEIYKTIEHDKLKISSSNKEKYADDMDIFIDIYKKIDELYNSKNIIIK